ncbi:bifunctional 2-polyprenyl-6-hydroxyphenol methylase/3-demethylubiquinol 3-O-methyltransferase UbiG [Shewanella surugensis]|uniref:Ubiquinone biosynthesis O-methyltransferase n=1 Tax=Shewanella surugensis TaxID=212020 RepID=A0ABT0LAC6_9GAMM|nr:bifunctional 2-polyprenyl-6-hydroxyphenol methylase/3-demethylubiquinol 3-O-methyltransferase UbiG [Shewanella surugensis]MCL1124646.1 bifunctional 2-polyprenyl-6-hydroxyphenol methylase/3-demethylubiquinol 3-O-methyltransferase UbiG [Shewanella surugensis]
MLDKSRLSAKIDTQNEIEKFNKLAKEWRDPKGKFKHVKTFNQTRFKNIRSAINKHFDRDLNQDHPFRAIDLLDIGCGAGLLSEPLADLGANVTGIDASAMNISIAKEHAQSKKIKVNYQHCLAEELLTNNIAGVDKKLILKGYDVILNTEVIEHVNDKSKLIHTCCQLLRPNGLLIMATLNRTIKSYLIAIIGAEYIMRYLPIGTHQWKHFVKPSEIITQLHTHQVNVLYSQGMSLNPFTHRWYTHKNTDVNYLLYATKPKLIKT